MLWSYQSVWFSKYGNLVETVNDFIDNSTAGYSAKELESILHVEVKHARSVKNSIKFMFIFPKIKKNIGAKGLSVKIR